MAINISIYSNTNTSTRTMTFDFVQDYLVGEDDPSGNVSSECFFKVICGARDTDNLSYPTKVLRTLSNPYLALVNKQKISGGSGAYTDVKSMIVDYVYDYVNGHTAGESGSTCKYKAHMKFSS